MSQTITYSVPGMSCDHCKHAVSGALSGFTGEPMRSLDRRKPLPCLRKVEGEPPKLLEMKCGERLEACGALVGERETDDPVVIPAAGPTDQPRGFGTVDELHGAVVPEEQVVRGLADGGCLGARVPADGEQQLVLCRRQAGSPRLPGTPPFEVAQTRSQGK